MVFKDQRGFAMLFSFQNSIDSVCFCFHAHRMNTDLKIEQHSKTTLIFKNQFSSNIIFMKGQNGQVRDNRRNGWTDLQDNGMRR